MRIFTVVILIFLIFNWQSCRYFEQDKKVPLSAFFKNAEKSNFHISPNGEYISFLQPHKGVQNLYVTSINSKEAVRITTETDRNIVNYFWVDNEELIFWKERTMGEKLGIYAVNRKSLSVRNLLVPANMKFRWVAQQLINKDEVLISLNKRDSSVFDVYRLNIHDCGLKMVAKNPGNISNWFVDLDGKIRLAVASDGVNETLLYRKSETDAFKEVINNNFKTTVKPISFIKDKPDHIYALSNMDRDKLALVEIDLDKGEEVKTLYVHPEVDVSSARYSEVSGNINYVEYHTQKPERFYFNKQVEKVYQKLRDRLANNWIQLVDFDQDEKRFILRAYADDDPGAVYWYNPVEDRLVKLADVNPALLGVRLCKMKAVHFTSNDGLEINGYLTLPVHRAQRKLPLIVIPHNGPSSRNVWEYNSEVQFLANRGYAVFQLNYRGSTGYGKAFWSAGFGQWGGKLQEDIATGVRILIEKGIADSSRIGIFGYSFGGFCALYGACFHSDLYRCAASYSGITNLFTYLKEIPPYYKPYLQMYYEMVGNPEQQADYFKAVSPVFHTDKIKGPIFIAQGGHDERANVNETNQIVRELKSKNIPITYLLNENEGHYFKNEASRLEFYGQLEAFFKQNLGKN